MTVRSSLEDGHYLSTYLAPPGIAALSAIPLRHDQNLTLWRVSSGELELVRHWELERVTRRKQDAAALPSRAAARSFIAEMLAVDGVDLSEVRESWGTPGLDRGARYGSPDRRLPLHAVAHLYTAAFMDSEQFRGGRMLCLAADGGPDHVLGRTALWYAGGYVDRGELTFFPIESPGRMYDSAEKAFKLRAGTLMALAGVPEFDRPDIDADSLVADLSFHGDGPRGLLDGAVQSGHLVVRRAQDIIAVRGFRTLDGFTTEEVVAGQVMALVQRACEAVSRRTVERLLSSIPQSPSSLTLGVAGGYALNCPTNSMLVDRYGFAGLAAPPCPNDSGQAIGVGLATFHARSPDVRFQFPGAYCGAPAGDVGTPSTPFDPSVFVADVVAGPVGWVTGDSEIGPRALGHRSLLADPRSAQAKATVNRVKGRQWWRPVAPVVLAAQVAEWFIRGRASPFMLETFQVAVARRHDVPAITHLDGSARVQTLTAAQDPLLHTALTAFATATGIPMLGNTSMNDRGEPIVRTAEEALSFCADKAVRICYIDGQRHEVVATPGHRSVTRPPSDFGSLSDAQGQGTAPRNPHGLSRVELHHVATTPSLADVDLTDVHAAERVRHSARDHFERFPSDLEWVTRRVSEISVD